MSILDVKNVSHGFGSRVILEDASFRLLKGEHIGLVGANGEGKTTFLNIITGNLMPDEGTVTWCNHITTGYLDQYSTLEKGKTIRDILKSAFNHMFELEQEMMKLYEKMGDCTPEEMDALMEEVGEIQSILDSGDFYSLDLDKRADQPYIFQEIGKTLDKYSFSDKSEDSYGGRVTTKEITSDRVIENLEFGVGIAYENTEYYDSQYEKQNSDIWTHTPVYATGKYKLSSDEESTKYLKLNLGYAIGEYENLKEYNEIRNQSGMYYGVGGGIEYSDISLDLIYQVNKDAYERDNSSQDDSRITFSVDYKLDF